MTSYSEGEWVKYRHRGIYVTRVIIQKRPDGCLITGEHKHANDTHCIDPEIKDSLKKVEDQQ